MQTTPVIICVLVIVFATIINQVYHYNSEFDITKLLSQSQIDTYNREGILILDKPLFNPNELSIITKEINKQIENRVPGVRSEDILNYHFNNSYLLQLASNKRVLNIVEQLLNTSYNNIGIRIFTTRILSKKANINNNNKQYNSIKIPWHQDSNYWNHLNPLTVVSLWLAINDVDETNGAMEMYNFTACPQCKNNDLPITESSKEKGVDFFRYIAEKELPNENLRIHNYLKKGYASFHDAYVPHYSPINLSPTKTRTAWIVRYCRGDTVVIPGKRKLFPADYNLIKVR